MASYFELFITCVDKIGPSMLRIWGQQDRVASMFIEQLLKNASVQFEAAHEPPLEHLEVGLLCAAKYKDGAYYRAQILNLRNILSGTVEVKFIDYGNTDHIQIGALRLLHNCPLGLTTQRAQAVSYILANVIHVHKDWDDLTIRYLNQEIRYMELQCGVVGAYGEFKFIKLLIHDTDYADYLIHKGIAMHIPLAAQEMLVRIPLQQQQQQKALMPPPPVYNYSMVQQPAAQHHLSGAPSTLQEQKPAEHFFSFKKAPLKPNTEHYVYVSFVEDGPFLFSVQFQQLEEQLDHLMSELNKIECIPLIEAPLPGFPCMARCLEDNTFCRAVVIDFVEDKCKIYYVDFGNTVVIPYDEIYQIPIKFISPKVFSLRFTLAGLKHITVTSEMKSKFKDYVTDKLLRLKVLQVDNSIMQYCELYDGDQSILDIIYDTSRVYDHVQVAKGTKNLITVSYIHSCKKFYVQLNKSSAHLADLMKTLSEIYHLAGELDTLELERPCIAYYAEDSQWYRAKIIRLAADDSNTATVKYIDYGNEETVPCHYLKTIEPRLIKILPAQAIECCLTGYQNMSFNQEIENIFEAITLEQIFTMKVIGKQSTNTLLVDLYDLSENNVAALLIAKLAEEKSQVSPCRVQQVAKSLLQSKSVDEPAENHHSSWRNVENQEPAQKTTSWRDQTEKKTWRNNENVAPNDGNANWNGNSPTNKRSYQRTERGNPPRENTRSSMSGSEKSWSGGKDNSSSSSRAVGRNFNNVKRDFDESGYNNRNAKPYRSEVMPPKRKPELPPQILADFHSKFVEPKISLSSSSSVEVSTCWFYNPESFYIQLLDDQFEFKDLMADIQSAYNGRTGVNNTVPIGSAVIAEFHEDTILYRATVLEDKHPKYVVQYVDFGNKSVVDCSKIWQVETKFMKLPVQAIKCGLDGIRPSNGGETWTDSRQIDEIFNKASFQAIFKMRDDQDDKYIIELFDQVRPVREQLIEAGLAESQTEPTVADEEEVAIDLNLLYGQNIKVKLSYVQGLNNFFVQLDVVKANDVQEYVDRFMSQHDLLQPIETVEKDLSCIVKICTNDDHSKWCRGIIKDCSDRNALEIFHPDIGSSEFKSINEVYILPTQLCAFWYQAFECSLLHLSKEHVDDGQFKRTYEGQELIAYVGDIINLRLLVTLYDLNGKKLQLTEETNEDEYPVIDPVCPLPIFQSNQTVWISHVEDLHTVYFQRSSDAQHIALLLDSLFEFYEHKSAEALETRTVGELCCAKSEDGNWYRGRIQQQQEDDDDQSATILVQYIDYGNKEVIRGENLKKLDSQFYCHELALSFGFDLVETAAPLTLKERLVELVGEKDARLELWYGEESWLARVYIGEMCINDVLVEEKLAQVSTTSVQEEEHSLIVITHIDSPSEFYLQLVSNQDAIFALQTDLQERAPTLAELTGADVGVLCAVKYSIDDQWYRAEVLDADSDITTVRFIDYGNTDVVHNSANLIKTLPSDLLSIDKYARKCSLHLAPVNGVEWSTDATSILEQTAKDEQIYADIIYQDEKSKTYVDLYVNGANFNEKLIELGHAIAITRDEHEANNTTGFISHLNSISEFWIQLESSVPGLEMIVDRLASADQFDDLVDLSPGSLCAANFPDDQMWYRARILSNTVAGIEVLFVDYGNSSTALKLKVLPEDLIQMPIMAQKCSLNKPDATIQWNSTAFEHFKQLSADGANIFTIKQLTPGETTTVELYSNGVNIIDHLIKLCSSCEPSSTSSNTNSTLISLESHLVCITFIESISYFWVQVVDDSAKIDAIHEFLSTADMFEPLDDVRSGQICAAYHAKTKMWYRGKILEQHTNDSDQHDVLLIDFGKTLSTSDVRALPDYIQDIPPMAVLCELELPEGTTEWSDSAHRNFCELLGDSCTECRVEYLNTHEPRTVRLYFENENVADLINDKIDKYVEKVVVEEITESVCVLAESTELPVNDDTDLLEPSTTTEAPPSASTLSDDLLLEPVVPPSTTEHIEVSELLEQPVQSTTENAEDIEVSDEAQEPVPLTTEDIEASDEAQEAVPLTTEDIEASDEAQEPIPSTTEDIKASDEAQEPVPSTTEDIEASDEAQEPVPLTTEDIEASDEAQEAIPSTTEDIEASDDAQDLIEPVLPSTTEVIETRDDGNTQISFEQSMGVTNELEITEALKPNLVWTQTIVEPVKKEDFIEQDEELDTTFSSCINETITGDDTLCNIERNHSDAIVILSNTSSKSRPTTPHGDLNEEESSIEIEQIHQEFGDERKLSTTPHADKIVPGSICRGDLETPPATDVVETTPPCTPAEDVAGGSVSRAAAVPSKQTDSVEPRPITPKIPLDEKLLPASFTDPN